MEILSFIAGADSLRKLAVIVGVIFISFGALYPIMVNLELAEKKIKLKEASRIDSIDVVNLKAEVEKCDKAINQNIEKVKRLKAERDSLFTITTLTDGLKLKVDYLKNEISNITTNDKSSVSNLKKWVVNIQKTEVKIDSLHKEILNIDAFIRTYYLIMILAIIVGLIFLILGLCKWNVSQKKSDKLMQLEINIKIEEHNKIKEEITKLQKEIAQM